MNTATFNNEHATDISPVAVMQLKNTKMISIPEINEPDFEMEVLQSRQPVLVNFWAEWSQPCRVIEPVLDEVAAACNGRAKVVKVNVDDNPNLAFWYGIHCIPNLLCFINGEVNVKMVGTASKEAILAMFLPPAKAIPAMRKGWTAFSTSALKPSAEAAPSFPEPNHQTTMLKA